MEKITQRTAHASPRYGSTVPLQSQPGKTLRGDLTDTTGLRAARAEKWAALQSSHDHNMANDRDVQ